jgi:hypothetical protein
MRECSEHTLRFPQGVAEDDRRASRLTIGAPPCSDLGEDILLRSPAIDGEAERRFRNEGVAPHDLERRACRIGLGLVVARHDPHFSPLLNADLRGTEDMTGRVKRDANAVDVDRLPVFHGFDSCPGPQPGAQDMTSLVGAEVVSRSPACVIPMGVRDHRPVDGRPGVDEEAAGFAIEAAVGGAKEQRCLGGREALCWDGSPDRGRKFSALRAALDDGAVGR